MTVRLKQNLQREHAPHGLSVDREYLVLGISAGEFRVVNDDNDPVLYDPDLFDVVDPSEPRNWVSECGDDGERYARPAELDQYVWEDYHDRAPAAMRAVNAYLAKVGPCSWPVNPPKA